MIVVNTHTRNVKFLISDLFEMAKKEDIKISQDNSEKYFTISLSDDVLTITNNSKIFAFETYIRLDNDAYIFKNNVNDDEDVILLSDEKRMVFVPQDLLYYINNEEKSDEQNEIEALFG